MVNEPSGSEIHTDLPEKYVGSGSSFSATDMLAAALGVCIATNIGKVADRHGIPLSTLDLCVKKDLSKKPQKISLLQVSVTLNTNVSEGIKERVERAADTCLVHRSLHPNLNVNVKLIFK